ncbi:hypothetical protein ROZALSC1DRAFT_27223 [Rozella allomycis CSF55]|uniref:Long chronological lifespan protein 2 n=1 Tax=Rozella allomycis (strain CSF55) TaxID=988480 RepID=A0A075B093_ROZAC|nr:hypothetical protein O9G_003278 [Rozella allomycis CSF55]RKP21356.1 hypothetical protein ROZALSC1DRAFT_27223 [Rozella allomycis CSF55]|eukprot:EPZ35795.1 hypothetical protein O9G_003278 [Rozella allomycis CSF55]
MKLLFPAIFLILFVTVSSASIFDFFRGEGDIRSLLTKKRNKMKPFAQCVDEPNLCPCENELSKRCVLKSSSWYTCVNPDENCP